MNLVTQNIKYLPKPCCVISQFFIGILSVFSFPFLSGSCLSSVFFSLRILSILSFLFTRDPLYLQFSFPSGSSLSQFSFPSGSCLSSVFFSLRILSTFSFLFPQDPFYLQFFPLRILSIFSFFPPGSCLSSVFFYLSFMHLYNTVVLSHGILCVRKHTLTYTHTHTRTRTLTCLLVSCVLVLC